MSDGDGRGVVLLTGAAGKVGTALTEALKDDWTVVGLDLDADQCAGEAYACDLTDPESITQALKTVRERHGPRIASVIHLAAYFDFTGEDHPLYEKLNVEGTRHLLRALQWLEVEQFLYTSTMLVHRPGEPGERIDETAPVEPQWAYPQSKARAEEAIAEEHGEIPYVLLRLAGLYDEAGGVPTLTEQIARIYERDAKSRFYAGDQEAGQSFVHEADMADAVRRAVERRADIPSGEAILIGEPEAMSYAELQDELGGLIHGAETWRTMSVPKPLAKAAAWAETRSEPIVPDDLDQGEKPFIRPFMIDMAEDHYALDISKAERLLGWRPERRLRDALPSMVEALRADPAGWYAANGITAPDWLQAADERVDDADALRERAERWRRKTHDSFRWAHFLNIGLGSWLVASPPILGYESWWMTASDMAAGLVVMVLSFLCLSWRLDLVRWLVAAAGAWVMSAPLIFWAPTAAAYQNGTLVGALIFACAVCVRPPAGVSPVAATTGPTVPPGWDYSPSDWFQRMPIIILAFFGLYVSRYLAAYQLGHIDGVWEPFFLGAPENPKNGTEEIITSTVSEAWPVPDAGLGALTYLFEILIGLIGSAQRWRTMPWLVLLFGIMIVPLGVVSITFIVIQPILLGTWCTLCLMTAAAMLIQIPYSVDELIATCQFLARRRRAGRPLLRVLLTGDTDDGPDEPARDDFERPPRVIIGEMLGGGITLPWTLLATMAVGVWLMFTRLTLGTEGVLADADHLIGALAVTVAVTATAEAVRAVRFLNMLLGAALAITALVSDATTLQIAADVVAGLLLIGLSVPRGAAGHSYGEWSRFVV